MNQSQFMSLVKTLLGAASGFAIAKGWIDSDTAVAVTGAALLLAPLAWGLISHTDAANVATAASAPGVSVEVDGSKATPGTVALAADPKVTTVQFK